jgi:hypothetical protein
MEFESVRRSDAGGGSFDGVAGGRKEASSRGLITTDHGEAVPTFLGTASCIIDGLDRSTDFVYALIDSSAQEPIKVTGRCTHP